MQNRRQTPSGRKVSGRKKKEERKKKNNAKFSGHYVRQRMQNIRSHALCSDHSMSVNIKFISYVITKGVGWLISHKRNMIIQSKSNLINKREVFHKKKYESMSFV